MACPYFDCPGSQAMPAVRGAGLCECARANPVRVCASCGVKSQGGARFCRACRTEFRSAAAAPRAVSHSGFVLVPGNFYAPPVFWGGFAWCLAADGSVFRVALEAGSPPVQWASIPSANAGFGPPALVEIEDPKSAVRGPVLIAADDRAVYAVSLANRGVTKLHDTGASGGIRVNTSASESVRYRAIAATPEGFAFVGPAGAADSLLTIRAFNSEQAGRVIPLRG